jgi:hypothetical protein
MSDLGRKILEIHTLTGDLVNRQSTGISIIPETRLLSVMHLARLFRETTAKIGATKKMKR